MIGRQRQHARRPAPYLRFSSAPMAHVYALRVPSGMQSQSQVGQEAWVGQQAGLV